MTYHTSSGRDLNPGDLLGAGTISTHDDTGVGSLLELTCGSKQFFTLPTGETRTFLQDGDAMALAGRAVADGYISIGWTLPSVIAPAVHP